MPLAPDEVVVAAVASQAPTSPGFRARVLLPRPELARHQVRLIPYTLFTAAHGAAFARAGPARRTAILLAARSRLLRRLDEIPPATGVALIQRQADLLPSLRAEKRAAEGRRLVWDVDDAIWLDAHPDAHGHRLAVLKRTARKVRWLARFADEVVVANEILAEFLGRLTTRVTIVPSVVASHLYALRAHADRDEVVLGWIGSRTTAPYLSRLRSVLGRVSGEVRTRVRLVVVGGRPPPIPGVELDVRAWSEEAEVEALAEIDIGLMPVPNNAWTRGKSAYKAVVYMAAGIPVVADDVGVAATTVGHGRGGYIVRSDDEWVEAIVALAREPGLRRRLGRRGREHVDEHFSAARWAPAMAGILRGER